MKFSELNNGDLFKYGSQIFKKTSDVIKRKKVISNSQVISIPPGRVSNFIFVADDVAVEKIGVSC